ncbi:hypothetical protein BU23DRAFT_561116 [Bimuria novae-zelandiae CBS 107.79]|uniref:Uncharacterized protein n=1 Tax=Bimuria novae-zelandiae CBS 107.79 TaxID=1447943 RepID=A0A6A5UL10_9PLEO|nr:hypothetical protein BU23DRAFT_561116 [Bimuria novae-zelandiae CBS 107.79]
MYRVVRDQYNTQHLQNLFNNRLPQDPEQTETCGTILSTRSKLQDYSNKVTS